MDNVDKKTCTCGQNGSCGCGQQMGGYMHMHGGKHYLIKMILKLIIVIIIFWCGFKLGEITGSIRGEYGRGIMMGGNGFGMMRGGGAGVPLPTPGQ